MSSTTHLTITTYQALPRLTTRRTPGYIDLFHHLRNGAISMPSHIPGPSRITAAGTKPKIIEEYIGRVNTETSGASVARMQSPEGWSEPGQTPEFDEFTVVLKGVLNATHSGGVLKVKAGEALIVRSGEWVQYSTPRPGGADYIAVCLPAFSPELVHRDE
jgi:mannose-6-phosphate isomerase-like protein (cupin superfamily)